MMPTLVAATSPPTTADVPTAPDRLTTAAVVAPPPDVVSPASPPLAGEGRWTAVAGPDGTPVLERTFVRPDAVHTSEVVGIVRIRRAAAALHLFPGMREPGGQVPEPSAVPSAMRPRLVAAFNSGFRMNDSRGGFYEDAVAVAPLVDGAASVVLHTDGTADVGAWGRDVGPGADVVAVRQNLVLLVDGGRPVAGLDAPSRGLGGDRWGSTLGNAVLVWRSGLGETADGDLVYVAGPALSAGSLADLLVRAGAVRAMELDINADWTTFNLFHASADGSPVGEKLLPTMKRPPDRYLLPDSRDFFAVTAR